VSNFVLVYYIEDREVRVDVPEGTMLLGRSSKCDVTLEDKSISGKHARLDLEDGTLTLTDLDSSNGTAVDGKQTRKAVLHGGESIRLGRFRMQLEGGVGEAAPSPDETPPSLEAVAPAGEADAADTEPGPQEPELFTPPDGMAAMGDAALPARYSGGGAVQVLPPEPRDATPGSGAAARRKRLVFAAVVAVPLVILLGLVLLASMNRKPPPKNGASYTIRDYRAGFQDAAAAAGSYRYREAVEKLETIHERWHEAHPDRPRTAAERLATLLRPLAKAEAEEDFMAVEWMNLDDQLRDYRRTVPSIPDSVSQLLRQLAGTFLTADERKQTMRQARTYLANQQYDEARIKATNIPDSDPFYGEAAAKLRRKAVREQRASLKRTAYRHAELGNWAEAVSALQNYLDTGPDSEAAADLAKWQRWEQHRRTLEALRKEVGNADLAALKRIGRELEGIPDQSPEHQEAQALLKEARARERELAIARAWREWTGESLAGFKRLAETDPAYERDPHYTRVLERMQEIHAHLERAEALEEVGYRKVEELLAELDAIKELVGDTRHPVYQKVQEWKLKYTPRKRAAIHMGLYREALEAGEYAEARAQLEKAAQFGEDVQEKVQSLIWRANRFYNRGLAEQFSYDKLEWLERAEEILRPGDTVNGEELLPKVLQEIEEAKRG
jgi:hypothetical protein